MSIFSILTEAKIQDWFRRKSSGEIKESENVETIDNIKSFETYLLDDILLLIERSANVNPDERKILLQKANNMEIQLLQTLENDGFYLMAQMTAERIRKHRKKHKPQSAELTS